VRLLILTNDEGLKTLVFDLHQEGHDVTTCASVMSATALVEEFSPRAVFIDVRARGAIDFLKWLKKETGCGAIALLGEEDETRYKASGFDGWTKAPYHARGLLETLSLSDITTNDQVEDQSDETSFWDITKDIRATFARDDSEENIINSQTWKTGQSEIRVISQEVVSLWGAKGGVGRTTIAVQISRYLSDFDVLLIDLNFKEGPGDVNAILDLPVAPHVGKLLEEKNDRRHGFMEALIKPKNESFAIIQPPPTIDQAEQISPDDIIELVDQARRCFQIIIIDLPPDISPITLEAIDLSTAVLFVSDEHIGSLARVESIKTFVRKDIVKALVLNKFNAGLSRAKEFSYFLDIPLGAVISDYRYQKNKQISRDIKKDCDSIVNKGVEEIVEAIFGIEKQTSQARSGFSRLIKGAISNIIG
jgi:Flp pilus assembly CpaE family ATPase/CheY-like chemotaxis protein